MTNTKILILAFLIFTTVFSVLYSYQAQAESCTTDGISFIENCLIADPGGNIIISFILPTERTVCPADLPADTTCVDNAPLPISEIDYIKIYFHEINLDHWTEIKVPAQYTAVKIKKPAGEYEIFGTTVDTYGKESIASNSINEIIEDIIQQYIPSPNPPSRIDITRMIKTIIVINPQQP